VRPQPSPDGRYLAYVKRERAKSKLYVKDLRSGEERKIYDALDQDMQETWAVHGVYPNMDWTPDSRSLVFWAGGKIHRIAPDGSGHAEIPFQVADSRDVIDPPRPQVNVFSETFTTKMPRYAALSPDGRRVVFESLGRLYVKDASGNAAPRLLTPQDADFQLFPSWSRDGSRIVFVSWNDQRLGELRTINADGSGLRTISQTPGHYRRPRFSPDGQTIVYENRRAGDLTSEAWSGEPGVYRIAANGGTPVRLVRDGGNPQFGATGDRVYIEQSADQKLKLVSVDMNGKDPRTHAQGELVVEYQVAPAGDHIAFRENYNVFVVPFFQGAKTLDLGAKAGALPVTKATGIGGQYLHWSGNTLAWSLGPQLYTAASNALIRADGGKYAAPASGIPIGVTARADVPTGVTALVGAKVVTMADESGGIIEDGVVLIEGNRIRQVGRRGQVNIPAGARQVDVAGKFIIPGLIDAHAHGSQGEDDLVPQQNWEQLAHLAFGVTTVHDPSSTSSEIFPAGEMQRAGVILAPRTFSTGRDRLRRERPGRYAVIDSLDDALAHVRRLKIQGRTRSRTTTSRAATSASSRRRRDRREYRRRGRRRLVYEMDMALIADGNTTLEHNIPQARSTRTCSISTGHQGGLHADAGRHLWRAWREPYLDQRQPGIQAPAPHPPRACRRSQPRTRPGDRGHPRKIMSTS
jgi:Tol biopolymer transport system component